MGLVNIQNTNFENGVTNRNAADLFGSMGQLDPTKFHTHMDDFSLLAATFAESGYTAPATGAAVGLDAAGGALEITTGATGGNIAIIQANILSFNSVASSRLYHRQRLNLTDVTNTIMIAGLAASASGVTPTDGIFFQKLDTLETLDVVVRSGSAEIAIASAVATVLDGVDFTCEFYFDGIDRVYYGVDGTPLGFIDLAGLALPTGLLAPTVGGISGAAAGAKVIDVDYLFTAQER